MEEFEPVAEADVAGIVADLYYQVALQSQRLRAVQVANGDSDDDPAAGASPRFTDGQAIIPTYAAQMAAYSAQMTRLRDKYVDVWTRVEAILRQRKEQLDSEGQT